MQQALENPHFKKIWEEVNWKIRHPEAKSLEGALQEELNHYGCCFFNPNQTMSTGVIVGWDNAGYRYISTEGIDDKKQSIIVHIKDKFYQNSLIIGRLITLEDILILFGKTFNETLNGFKFVQLTCEGAFITMKPIEHHLHRIEVILGKPLHEQRPKTWEEISELIK